jgi:hypothetical protein
MGLQAAFLQFLYKLCGQGAEISAADDNKADQKKNLTQNFRSQKGRKETIFYMEFPFL